MSASCACGCGEAATHGRRWRSGHQMRDPDVLARAIRNRRTWRGGRIVDPRGYVLIKLPDHPRADVRGYVYEHVLVAEKKVGRPLKPGEQVHHADEDKGNNHPSNLIVAANPAAHRWYHRKPGSRLRNPGEPNRIISCACGCGQLLPKYDGQGRPRHYLHGHALRDIGHLGRFKPGHKTPNANSLKTHCKRGHLFDDRNTYRTPSGRRKCRACLRAHAVRYRNERDRKPDTGHRGAASRPAKGATRTAGCSPVAAGTLPGIEY